MQTCITPLMPLFLTPPPHSDHTLDDNNHMFPDPETPRMSNPTGSFPNPSPNLYTTSDVPVLNPHHSDHTQEDNNHMFPDPETPRMSNPTGSFPNPSPLVTPQSEHDHANLNSAILSLSLGNPPITQTPLTSPASNPILAPNLDNPPNTNLDQTNQTIQYVDHNAEDTATFILRPPCALPSGSNLHWTWVGDNGPFMTNGSLRENSRSSSATDSDETVLMFNLDRLNEDCPEWVRRNAWSGDQIPDMPVPYSEDLIQRADRNRFEVGGSSDGPRIRRAQEVGQDESWTQYLVDNET